jgi:hypothetical protein
MTDFTALKSQIEALIGKAAKEDDASEAMKFAQAATNASQAMYALRDIDRRHTAPGAVNGQPVSPQIAHMVDQFLSWKLPKNFKPDGGIEFYPLVNQGTEHERVREPTGTNLFDYTQAEAMVLHMLEGLP